jgi:hypothetical protein
MMIGGDGVAATNTHLTGNIFAGCGVADSVELTITWALLAGRSRTCSPRLEA